MSRQGEAMKTFENLIQEVLIPGLLESNQLLSRNKTSDLIKIEAGLKTYLDCIPNSEQKASNQILTGG